MKPLLMIVLVFGPALFLILISLNKCEHNFTQLPDYGSIGEYKFYNEVGEFIENESFNEKIVVFNIIQTSCPSECSIDIPKFNLLIYQHYVKHQKKMSHLKFISIVTDRNGEPVSESEIEEMKFTLQDIIPDFNDSIWMLVSGDPKQVYDIESNNVNLFEQREEGAFSKKPFMETMMIIDKTNHLRLVRRGTKEGYIRDFKEHLALLQKQYDKEDYAKNKGE